MVNFQIKVCSTYLDNHCMRVNNNSLDYTGQWRYFYIGIK